MWLNENNSIYVDPTSESVANGVQDLIHRKLDSFAIREQAIALMHDQRRYVAEKILQPIFVSYGCEIDPVSLMLGSNCWITTSPYRHKLSAEFCSITLADTVKLICGNS